MSIIFFIRERSSSVPFMSFKNPRAIINAAMRFPLSTLDTNSIDTVLSSARYQLYKLPFHFLRPSMSEIIFPSMSTVSASAVKPRQRAEISAIICIPIFVGEVVDDIPL